MNPFGRASSSASSIVGMGIVRCHELSPREPWKTSDLVVSGGLSLLFWVISGISEDPWIDSSFDPVVARNNDPVYCGMNEVIIQHVLPHCLHELAPAMCHELAALSLPVWVPTRNPTFE